MELKLSHDEIREVIDAVRNELAIQVEQMVSRHVRVAVENNREQTVRMQVRIEMDRLINDPRWTKVLTAQMVEKTIIAQEETMTGTYDAACEFGRAVYRSGFRAVQEAKRLGSDRVEGILEGYEPDDIEPTDEYEDDNE